MEDCTDETEASNTIRTILFRILETRSAVSTDLITYVERLLTEGLINRLLRLSSGLGM